MTLQPPTAKRGVVSAWLSLSLNEVGQSPKRKLLLPRYNHKVGGAA
jgi:hypothetical protein